MVLATAIEGLEAAEIVAAHGRKAATWRGRESEK
jgi:hypothetical protein